MFANTTVCIRDLRLCEWILFCNFKLNARHTNLVSAPFLTVDGPSSMLLLLLIKVRKSYAIYATTTLLIITTTTTFCVRY
jgi:hypothetical protein